MTFPLRPSRSIAAALGAAAMLAVTSTAAASDSALRTTLNTWSATVGADAHSVALAAQNRHPRRLVYSALRFRRDALHARLAILARRPSSARGLKAKRLALAAFTKYAAAGADWAASGRARLAGHRTRATADAKAGAALARSGNTLLVAAGKLLP